MLPLFAVHISDGVLGWPMLALGFAGAAVLAALAAWRVREEEIPRIALMTAAFFVASSIHVKLGPTSVHLLLNGLVGVVLGRRAPLAILVGVTLQALLIPHGGISTIGVNALTEMLPALLCAALFTLVCRVSDERLWFRSLLVASAALVWGWCLLFGVALLWTAPLSEAIRYSPNAGLVLNVEDLSPALSACGHPAALGGLAIFAALAVILERRLNTSAGFPRGALMGVLAVVCTTLLTGLVLLLGTADDSERWDTFVSAVFLAHLPLALIEGLIVGSIVAFLGRVKPEMLVATVKLKPATGIALALAALLGLASPVQAHGLNIFHQVDREKKEITVDCIFEGGGAPKDATVLVHREDETILAEGKLDRKGRYSFRYEKPEALVVTIKAEGGHRAEKSIRAAELGGAVESVPAGAPQGSRIRDLLLGVALVLSGTAFVLAWRNSVRLAGREKSPPDAQVF